METLYSRTALSQMAKIQRICQVQQAIRYEGPSFGVEKFGTERFLRGHEALRLLRLLSTLVRRVNELSTVA